MLLILKIRRLARTHLSEFWFRSPSTNADFFLKCFECYFKILLVPLLSTSVHAQHTIIITFFITIPHQESGSDLGCICRIYASTIKFGLAFRYGLPVQFGTFQHMCKPGLRYQYSTRTVHAVPLQADLVRRYRPKKYRYRGETGTFRIPAYELYLTSPKQIVATSRTTIVLNLLR